MGEREDNREELLDFIIPLYEKIIRIYGGFNGTSLVDIDYRRELFDKLCEQLKIKAEYNKKLHLHTCDDFAYHFMSLLEIKKSFVDAFANRFEEVIGRCWKKREIICCEDLPKSKDKAQNKREEIAYALKLGKIKNKICQVYAFYPYGENLYYANTIEKLAEVFYLRR